MEDQELIYPDFYITPRILWLDERVTPQAEKVYSVIYWYSQLKNKKCYASNKTIAASIGADTHVFSVSRAVKLLAECGYVGIVEKDDRGRRVLIPLVNYEVSGHNQMVMGGKPNGYATHNEMVIHNKNNKKNKESLVQKHKDEVGKLYNGWLISMVIGSRVWLATPESERDPLLASAAKKVRLTEPRKEKLARSIDKLGYSSCANAIKNIAHSEHHRGVNDRGWKATIDWLFKSYEKTEEWANR